MAHKTTINATEYEITGGTALKDGTKFQVGGRTIVDGTGGDISFSHPVRLILKRADLTGFAAYRAKIKIGEATYFLKSTNAVTNVIEDELEPNASIEISVEGGGYYTSRIQINAVTVVSNFDVATYTYKVPMGRNTLTMDISRDDSLRIQTLEITES